MHDTTTATWFSTLFRGRRLYTLWLGVLTLLIALGLQGYTTQWQQGLAVTGMTDQIVWGLYISQFTFLVGLAASAILLVLPACWSEWPDVRRVTLLGESMAICAVIMSLLFVMADLGQPVRIWHALPFIGRLHYPASILAWDFAILTLYLTLNLGLVFYGLRSRYLRPSGSGSRCSFWMVLAIVLGIGIHTVTAFMLSGLPARPFWHSAVLAPRFIASAFASGSAVLLLWFWMLEKKLRFAQSDAVVRLLAGILTLALWIDLFLLGSELFVLSYRPMSHAINGGELYFGLVAKTTLTPWIRSAIAAKLTIAMLLVSRTGRRRAGVFYGACIALIPAIMIEKGIGLVVSGFQPTPLGEWAEYFPTLVEIQVTAGIWAFGLLLLTWLTRIVVAVESGALTSQQNRSIHVTITQGRDP